MIDIVILVIALVVGLIGAKKGLISAVTKLVGFIVAIILASTFYDKLAVYLTNNYGFAQSIEQRVETAVANIANEEEKAEEESSIQAIIDKIGLSETEDNKKLVSSKITRYIMNAVAYGGIFVSTVIIFGILGIILSAIFSLPVLKSANRIGGFIFEVIQFLIVISVVLYIASLMKSLSFMQWTLTYVERSVILKMIYNHNIVTYLLPKLIKLI